MSCMTTPRIIRNFVINGNSRNSAGLSAKANTVKIISDEVYATVLNTSVNDAVPALIPSFTI